MYLRALTQLEVFADGTGVGHYLTLSAFWGGRNERVISWLEVSQSSSASSQSEGAPAFSGVGGVADEAIPLWFVKVAELHVKVQLED